MWYELDRITFETDSATLKPQSREQLSNIAAISQAYPRVRLKVGGYTDNSGDATRQRAAVAGTSGRVSRPNSSAWESERARLEAEGYGAQHPVADNATRGGPGEEPPRSAARHGQVGAVTIGAACNCRVRPQPLSLSSIAPRRRTYERCSQRPPSDRSSSRARIRRRRPGRRFWSLGRPVRRERTDRPHASNRRCPRDSGRPGTWRSVTRLMWAADRSSSSAPCRLRGPMRPGRLAKIAGRPAVAGLPIRDSRCR